VGNAALSLSGTGLGISITGSGASDFSQTNACGTSIAAGGSCEVYITFKPLSAGSLTATVVVGDSAFGSPQKVTLSGTGTGPVVSLSKTSLTFASTAIGSASASQAVTVKNTGNAALSLSGTGLGISLTGTDASSWAQTNTCGTSLAAGGSCTVTVTFKPLTSGSLPATLNLADSAYLSPQKVSLSGTGTGPVVTLSHTSLTFPSTVTGTSAPRGGFGLGNAGNAALTLSGTGLGITITGTDASSFSQTNACGTSVAAGSTCEVYVTFKPLVAGTLTATVNIADNAHSSPQKVTLTGTATSPAVTLTPTSLSFPTTVEDTTSPGKAIVLKNSGTVELLLSGSGYGIKVAGADPTSFSETNNCGASLAAGASCNITVTFKPESKAALSASLSIADNAGASPQTVSLTGTGN